MIKIALKQDDLEEHLVEQIMFLNSSCEAYDNGFLGEAKRIAVTLRVLFHDTRASHSLLGQLNKKNNQFVSTSIPMEEASLTTHGGLVFVAAKGKETKYIPMLDDTPFSRWCTFEEWWEEPVFVDDEGNKLTREKLVLTAANQDGGAHIDSSLERTYSRISKENSLGLVYREGENIFPITKPERAAIRQIGHEVLKTLLIDYNKKQNETADFFFGGAMLVKGTTPPPLPKEQKIGRNDLCPCGSGKKYKKCHGN